MKQQRPHARIFDQFRTGLLVLAILLIKFADMGKFQQIFNESRQLTG